MIDFPRARSILKTQVQMSTSTSGCYWGYFSLYNGHANTLLERKAIICVEIEDRSSMKQYA